MEQQAQTPALPESQAELKKPEQNQKEAEVHDLNAVRAKLREQMTAVLDRHRSMEPDGLIILSLKNGQYMYDTTHFPSLGDLSFAQKLLNLNIDRLFSDSLQEQARMAQKFDAAKAKLDATQAELERVRKENS